MNSPLELSSVTAEKAQRADSGYAKLLVGRGERRSIQPLLTWARSEYDKERKTEERATVKVGEKQLNGNKDGMYFLQVL